MIKSLLICLATASAIIVSGCATTKPAGDFCLVSSPIRPSVEDDVTDGTKRQILAHNEYGAKACNWRP